MCFNGFRNDFTLNLLGIPWNKPEDLPGLDLFLLSSLLQWG
jgi:hypothetical protein